MRRTGAQMVWEILRREGVQILFGSPGGAILPIYDALVDYPIHHVLVRHEENAALAADGYARATGKVGVCMATSGPGAMNLVTGLACAMLDSSPVVAITGQVTSHLVGSDAFQEIDVTGVTLPITKHNYLVNRVEELPRVMKEAFYIARSGRPGPVLIDICKDAQMASTGFEYPETIELPGYRPVLRGPEEQIRQAAAYINAAERPVILAGHGIILSGANDELRELAERGNIPVSTTLLGIGGLQESHPLNLRMMGMHGQAYANMAIQEADLLIALGMRFDDRVTGNLKSYAPRAEVIHVDIDPVEIGKNVRADVGIVGDAKQVLRQILPFIEHRYRSAWFAQIERWRGDAGARDILNQGLLKDMLLAPYVVHEIWRGTGGDITVVSDVGQNQMWEAQYFQHDRQNQLITSGGLGSMGFAVPAAIGTKFGRPDDEVWAVVGDGGFQMSIPELATVVQEKLPLKIAVINNGCLGMVRQWQELLHDRRYSEIRIAGPDLVKLADAYGIKGQRVRRPDDVAEAIRAARQCPGPVLTEFVVEPEINVFPMVQPGKGLHEMLRRPMPSRNMAMAEKV